MQQITAYETKGKGIITVADSRGGSFASKDAAEILAWVVKQPGDINVVYDGMDFYQPIFALLPNTVVNALVDGKAAHWAGFRLWFGKTRRGRVIGIRYNEPLGHNQFRKVEKEIYELKQYCELDKAGLGEMVELAENVLKTFSGMGFKTDRLVSAASIYEENILDKMPLPTMLNMKEESLDTHVLAHDNIQEWKADFRSGDWDKDKGKVYSYDLAAAYPSALAELPNLHWVKDYERSTEIPMPGFYYGIMYGTIHNKTLVSPLINPETARRSVGYWKGTMNTWEYMCCLQWNIADFEMEYGHFITLGKYHKLFDYSMRKLYAQRNGGSELQDNLAKAMAVSVIGKFQEEHGENFGDLYNPIYADMVTSLVRVWTTDFIYSNKIQDDVVSITVDGIKSLKKLDIPATRQFGEWRSNG